MNTKPPPANARATRLIRLPMLLAAVFGIGGIMFALFPSEQRLKRIAEQRKSDGLSVAYLQLLLRTHPSDTAIRYTLGRNLAALGKWDEARKSIEPMLSRPGNEGLEARLAVIEIDWSMLNALPGAHPDRVRISAALAARIEKLIGEPMQPSALARLAQISGALSRPDLTALLYQKLAGADPAKQHFWLDQAAREFLASGAPLQAARAFEAIAAGNQDDLTVRRKYTLLALDAYLAANDGKAALKLAETATGSFGDDREFMQRVVAIALAQNDLVRAQQLGRRLLTLAPDDPVLLVQQADVELAAKDLAAALSLARHLVALAPDSNNRTRLARIAEWSGQQAIALEQWALLGRLNPAGEEMERALGLAIGREDDALWLELAGRVISLRPLKSDEKAAVLAIRQRKKAPQLLVRYLQHYLDRYPAQRELWKALAETQEEQGDVTGAIATWQRVGPELIGAVESAVYQAILLSHVKRADEGLAKLRAVRSQASTSDLDYWKVFGDLAWERKQSAEALSAYRIVWESGAAQAPVAERLIQSYNAAQEPVRAIAVGREAYLRFAEPRWLLLAMDSASNGSRWDDLRALMSEARKEETKFQNLEMYWLLQAHIANHDGQKPAARSAYHRALSLNPASVSTRVTLLWFEIDGGDRQQLGQHLRQWHTDAQSDPAYWGPYAAGMLYLHRVDESLPWFQRKLRQQPDDYLWSLSYADALTQAGRADQAWRLRRFVLTQLRPQFTRLEQSRDAVPKPLSLAYATLVRDFDGPSAGDRILLGLLEHGYNDADVHELLVASYLSQEKFEAARHWLLRAHAERHKLPAWQSLAVALGRNDKGSIEKILADPEDNLSATDRIVALRRLGRNAEALAFADDMSLRDENMGNELLRQQKESLTRQQARFAGAAFGEKRIANLKIQQGELRASVPAGSGRATVRLAENRLSSTNTELMLAGISKENDISAIVELPLDDGLMRLTLGSNQRSDDSLIYGRYEWTRRLDNRVNARLEASLNGLSDETAALRAIGKKDRLAAGVTADLSDSEYARMEVAGQRYRTRSDKSLGNGYRIDGELGSTIFKKIPIWQIRLAGSWEQNRLEDSLPANLAGTVLPQSATIANVVSDKFGSLGVGSTLRFGDPDGGQGLYYGLIDGLFGRQWPGKNSAYSLRFVIGMPVSKPDEFRLEAFYSNVQGGLAGQASRGIGLSYRHVF